MYRVIFFLMCLMPFAASARTIHWLTFIDTDDPRVGEFDVVGREVLYNRFIHVVNAALADKGCASNIQDIYGKDLSPQKCKEIISSFKCEPEDIVVFYYIGHGTHGTIGGGIWPMMNMGQFNADYLVPLEWVHNELKGKGPQLLATIGMCCNSFQEIGRKSAPTFGVNYGNATLNSTELSSIQKMFLDNKGDIIVSSASPGQSSFPWKDCPLGPMDYFTCVLVENFDNAAYDGTLDWNTLFSDIKDVTNTLTQGNQTPIFLPNISKAGISSTSAGRASTIATQNIQNLTKTASSNQEIMNKLALAFDDLVNTNLSPDERMDQADAMVTNFASNAIVKVLGQDGNVEESNINMVVDKAPASEFLDRISTSRLLLKVVPVEVTMNGNKISQLKVKEVYKK